MGRNSFVLYTEYKEPISLLSVEEKAQLLEAIFEYADGNEVELKGAAMMAFSFIKAQMDRDTEKYEEICKKRREAGAKGGAPIGNKNAKQAKQANGCINNQNKQTQAKQPDNDNDNEDDNENDNVNDNENDNENVSKKRKVKKKSTLSLYENVKANYPLSENMDITLTKWFTYRDSIKKPLTEKSIEQLIEKVMALERQYGYSAVDKCFNNSISNGYQGVFLDKIAATPIKDNKNDVDEWFRKELGG